MGVQVKFTGVATSIVLLAGGSLMSGFLCSCYDVSL